MSIGIWQIALIILVVVLLFGRGKISDLMGDVAKGVKAFRKGLNDEPTEPRPTPGTPEIDRPGVDTGTRSTDDVRNKA